MTFQQDVLNIWQKSWVLPLCLLLFMGVLMSQTQRRVAKIDAEPGFALDDSWIHASIAQNMIRGSGYGINEGQWIPLSTSPAWTFLLAACMILFGDPVIAGLVAGFLAQYAAVVLMYLLAYRLTQSRFWALIPAVLLPLNPVLLWGYASGMELPLVAFSVTLCLYVYDATDPAGRPRRFVLPLALLLGVLTRPELFILVPMAILATGYQILKVRCADIRKAIGVMAIQSAIFLAGIFPYFLFNYATTQHFFPTAFHVKASLRDVGLLASIAAGNWQRVWYQFRVESYDELRDYAMTFLRFNKAMILLLYLGLISFCHPFRRKNYGRSALLLSMVFFMPLIMGVVSPLDSFSNYANRYLGPFVPPVTLLGCLGIWLLWSKLKQRTGAILCLVLILIPVRMNYRPTLRMYARDVANTNALYVESGRWVQEHIDPSIPVAMNDIGGISYFIDHEVVDIMGLATPDIWPYLHGTSVDGIMTAHRAQAIRRYLKERGIQYLIMSPRYYPDLHRESDVFMPVMTWDSVYPTGRSINPQILYKLNWEHAHES